MDIDKRGWCPQAQHFASPNHNPRPSGTAVSLLVLHNISLPAGQFGTPHIQDLFLNRLDCDTHPDFASLRDLRVSAHFLIRRDGRVLQFVSTLERAWHAGVSNFQGREGCNDFSIGIELEGTDFEPFEAAQYASLRDLSLALIRRHEIACVAGHQHIAPGRKTDPGPYFDWQGYAEQLEHAQLAAFGLVLTYPLAGKPVAV
jgi:AmpD protein